jgi:quercetin dioxygenase-like cupin family protein
MTPHRPADASPRSALLRRASLRLVHVQLAPGEEVPEHRHPGNNVLIQGLAGTLTVAFAGETAESETAEVSPGQLLLASGETPVALRNHSDEEVTALVTLVKQPDSEG